MHPLLITCQLSSLDGLPWPPFALLAPESLSQLAEAAKRQYKNHSPPYHAHKDCKQRLLVHLLLVWRDASNVVGGQVLSNQRLVVVETCPCEL